MIFEAGKLRLEMTMVNKNIRLEVSKGDQHQSHLISIDEYTHLLEKLSEFNKSVILYTTIQTKN